VAVWWNSFVRTYGWRAYALPLLVVVTVAALLTPTRSAQATDDSRAHAATRAPAPARTTSAKPAPVQQIALPSDSPCARPGQAKLVVVSITAQRAWMCQGQAQLLTTLVTTGAANVGNGTPTGTWQIQAKQRDRYLIGPGYKDFVHYWMPFDGDFGFHDAPWQTMPYGSAGYRDNGSHGCVHLPAKAMAWFFTWAQVGTTVTITA
jgi:lipoprotein-anchoring transpeptidase ErfK/SrfK